MTFTMNDVVLLLVMLLMGLVLGLMISGRGRFKRLWREEQAAHRHMIGEKDARIDAANRRIAELEQRNGPIGPGTAAVAGAVQGRDDLTRIHGISRAEEIALNEAGYHRYGQIVALNEEQQATLEARLGYRPGQIARNEWVRQAQMLSDGRTDDHASDYKARRTVL